MTNSFHIQRIRCENFMPYHDEIIEFPNKNGIVIVSGLNGYGKTSIVSAIRFVLFGRVNPTTDGQSAEEALFEAVNYEGRDQGKYSCKVTLDIDYLGVDYKIIRSYSPKSGVKIPKTPADYDPPTLSVVSNDHVLNEKQEKQLLSKIMSENVSRFYLFDGELLDEYKKILFLRKRTASSKMRDAIEDILGLPLLQNTSRHLSEILDEKKTNFEKATKNNNETERYASMLEDSTRNLQYHKEQRRIAEENIGACYDNIEELQNTLSKNNDVVQLIEEKNAKTKELEKEKRTLEKKRTNYTGIITDAWSVLLYPMLTKMDDELHSKFQSLSEVKIRYDEQQKQKMALTKALEKGYCNQCGQKLNSESSETLRDQLDKLLEESDSKISIGDVDTQIQSFSSKLAFIKKFTKTYDSRLGNRIRYLDEEISESESSITDLNAELAGLSRKLSEIEVNSEMLETIREELLKEEKNLSAYKKAYEEEDEKVKEKDLEIERIQNKIGSLQGSDTSLRRAVMEKELVSKLYNLFGESIEVYRQEKRKSVEAVTSELYKELTSVDWIGGLHITEDYGVEAYDTNGKGLPRPSSGYAHLAAFSLIGGLHSNVPIKGPLFMDTPSGRIDKRNTLNLIRVLPKLSNQVILLTHDMEFNITDLRTILDTQIIAEYEIQQISETRSRIKLRKGGET